MSVSQSVIIVSDLVSDKPIYLNSKSVSKAEYMMRLLQRSEEFHPDEIRVSADIAGDEMNSSDNTQRHLELRINELVI